MGETGEFLAPERVQYFAELAEQARAALSRFVGYHVGYDNTALQLLDEWIDRHLRQFPAPSASMRLLWTSFLGEVFRRHYDSEWAIRRRGKSGEMVVVCRTETGEMVTVEVSAQINRRIAEGMSASLVYFYTMTSIELKAG